MREVMPELTRWWEAGATVGMGTVVAIRGASPHEPGASMVVGPSGEVVGSVSGGCARGCRDGPGASERRCRRATPGGSPAAATHSRASRAPNRRGKRVAGGNDRRFPGG
jgi:XdhC and CoxI family